MQSRYKIHRRRATSSGVPSITIRPPPAPPSGPMSMSQSDVLITSRLCSITITVFPASTNPCRTSISFFTSAKCRPVVGSSSRYSVRPVELLAQFSCQFHALSFSAGQCRRRLPELHVIETDITERLQQPMNLWKALEQRERFANIEIQHVSNAVLTEFDLQRFMIEPPPFADTCRESRCPPENPYSASWRRALRRPRIVRRRH